MVRIRLGYGGAGVRGQRERARQALLGPDFLQEALPQVGDVEELLAYRDTDGRGGLSYLDGRSVIGIGRRLDRVPG